MIPETCTWRCALVMVVPVGRGASAPTAALLAALLAPVAAGANSPRPPRQGAARTLAPRDGASTYSSCSLVTRSLVTLPTRFESELLDGLGVRR